MREILFRGKQADNSEWIVGSLLQDDDGKTYIVGYEHRGGIDGMIDAELTSWAVIPETVGQYTGLFDKNGTKIFEGDIVTIENPNISDDEYGIVKFDNDGAMFIVKFDTFTVDFGNNIDGNQCEIIGNIFDNSELLKGEENE